MSKAWMFRLTTSRATQSPIEAPCASSTIRSGYFDRDEAQVPRFFEGRRAAGDQALARARLGVSGR